MLVFSLQIAFAGEMLMPAVQLSLNHGMKSSPGWRHWTAIVNRAKPHICGTVLDPPLSSKITHDELVPAPWDARI